MLRRVINFGSTRHIDFNLNESGRRRRVLRAMFRAIKQNKFTGVAGRTPGSSPTDAVPSPPSKSMNYGALIGWQNTMDQIGKTPRRKRMCERVQRCRMGEGKGKID